MATTPTPAAAPAPGAPIASAEQVLGANGATAIVEQVDNLPGSTPGDKGILYTQVRKPDGSLSRVAVKVNKSGCGCNEKQMGISRELMDRVEDAVKRTNVYVRADMAPAPITGAASETDTPPASPGEGISNARNVRINFTSLRLVYDVNGEEESMAINEVNDVALKTLLLDISKDLEHQATTDPSISSNRPLNRSTPLEIQHPQWHNAHRTSAENYATRDHQQLDASLRRDLNDETANRALPKIKAADHFVTEFRKKLEEKLREKKENMAALPPEDRGARHSLKRQIHQLEELIAKSDRQKLDMKAIYTSVPYANNELEGLSPDEQMRRADLSQSATQYSLNANSETIGNPGPAFITAYSQDKGDLLVHDRWKYEERVDDRGGEKRGPSFEEFVVYNILNLNNLDDTFLDDAISSLALPNYEAGDSEMQTAVRDALSAARADTRTKYTEDVNSLASAGSDLAAQTQALFPRKAAAPQNQTAASPSETLAMSRP